MVSLLISTLQATSQNLVPNPSFENFKKLSCKQREGIIQDFILNWFQPNGTATEYWNTLNSSSCQLNPTNLGIKPRTGTGMAGVISAVIQNNATMPRRGYVEIKLDYPLRPNHIYCGEYYVMHCSNPFSENSDSYESNNFGLALSESQIFWLYYTTPDYFYLPTKFNENHLVKASNSWQKISGCFIADKPYTHLLIGNFEPPESTVVNNLTNQYNTGMAYYFVDDVSLKELPYAVYSLASKVNFCDGDKQVELNATVNGAVSYTWQNGSTAPTLQISTKENRAYSVNIHFNELSFTHTFFVNYVPDIDLGPDRILCQEEKIVLKPKHPVGMYIWNDGSEDSVKSIYASGKYWVRVPSVCQVIDTLSVTFTNCPGEIPNVITPNGDAYNETFTVENIGIRNWTLRVINRWDEEVYYSAHYSNEWNATGLPEGTYYYTLYCQEITKSVKGWVQVVR